VDKLKWSTHTYSVVKKAQQCLLKFGLSPKTLTNFNRGIIESILSGCNCRTVKLLDYLLDITARSELEAQAFHYTHINNC
jgi:hypothetical protein